jgi:small neutral amino acid transporter SnatA (MarC family)
MGMLLLAIAIEFVVQGVIRSLPPVWRAG